MNKNYYCVIMAGGIGARFWPMSKTSNPKQFIDILGTGKTLIQQTFERLEKFCLKENIYIVTNDLYKDPILEQIDGISEEQILTEPMRRNTAPCIAYANYKIYKENPEATIVVAPSDHIILMEDQFTEVILTALKAAEKNDWLITLGIQPGRPDTGYGYIQFNENITWDEDHRVKKVKTFTEKPTLEIAKSFLKSGDFLWNAGIFVWSLKSILTAFNTHLEDVDSIFKEGLEIYNTNAEATFINNAYSRCKNISIDYGLMEKAENVYVLASDFGWSDLGTWGSLHEHRDKDKNRNSIFGKNVMTYDTEDCIIDIPDDKLVVVQGLKNFIVVEFDGVMLICDKNNEQNIKNIVNEVKAKKGETYI